MDPGVDHRPHHPQRERAIGARHGPDMFVGDARGAAPVGVDDHEARARLAGPHDESPKMWRRRERVPPPDDDVPGVGPELRIDLG